MQARLLKSSIFLLTCGLASCSLDWVNQQGNTPSNRQVVSQSENKVANPAPAPQNLAQANTSATNSSYVDQINRPMPTNLAANGSVGGNLGKGMDNLDHSKLSHALDNPLGKSSQWSNESTGVQYTVVPVQKVTIDGNTYCRKYRTTAVQGDKTREMSGVACVGANGTWESVSG